MISRTHPNLVKRLFETEVPEVYEGLVEIKSVSREAGSRTKIAVFSKDENVDPIGACIGPKGSRVGTIVELLCGEKIDIVVYNEDPKLFIAAALAPADVLEVEIDEEKERACHVTVPDTQLSLAIGNKGQNARLAAKLTGWKIDINPETEEEVINFDE
jgi:N utilization substance protein A